MRTVLAAIGAAALLAGCASNGDDMGPPMASDMTSPMSAMGYASMAGSSDQFEIQSSRLALQRSRNPQVRQFAQMMIDGHSRTTAELTSIAQSNGMNPPPPTLLPPQRAAYDRVAAAGPAEFDATYKREQIAGHQDALQLHRNYAAQGDFPPFRDFASRTAPIVESHLNMAQGLPEYAPPPPPPMPMSQPPARAGERG